MDDAVTWLLRAAPLIGSIFVPLFGVFWKISTDRKDPGAVRRMRRHSELYGVLPEAAKEKLLPLLIHEANAYSTNNLRKVQRHVDGGAVAALIIVAAATGGLLYPLIYWGLRWWPLLIFAVIVALLGLALIIVGLQQVFTYQDEQPKKPASSAKQTRK